MARRKKAPLRPLTDEEQTQLEKLSRSQSQSSASVMRAKAILAVALGSDYTSAAQQVGLRCGDTVSKWVSRFNIEGLTSLQPRHGGGATVQYGELEKQRILAEFQRQPERHTDGTATWSVATLRRALRQAPDGLASISSYTIWQVLKEAGYSWQKRRSWIKTGQAKRIRKGRLVIVTDPDANAKKNS
jgi:transposase